MAKKPKCLLPPEFENGHNLAYLLHDSMLELLRSGEEHEAFYTTLSFANLEDCVAFGQAGDIFEWLDRGGYVRERADILRVVVFPAILSDLLHFVYEALASARKAKLCVAYALLRKPLQENLFVLESIARDPIEFAGQLATDPSKLSGPKQGGIRVHTRLIAELLQDIRGGDQFDARYLSQLRYEKWDDGFDGACNLAMHLFTDHKKIKTEKLNVNFVFSNDDCKRSQWLHLYSRLPYLLAYTRAVVEHVMKNIAETTTGYLQDIELRIAAASMLWWMEVPDHARTDELWNYVQKQVTFIEDYHVGRGAKVPGTSELESIAKFGLWRSPWHRLRTLWSRRSNS